MGKGIVFVSGHFANWEIDAARGPRNLATKAAWFIVRSTIRTSTAISCVSATTYGPSEAISKGVQGTRRIFTLLRGGKSILILVDQKTNEGLAVPFFGRDAMTTPAPAAVSLKLGAVMLLVTNERMGGARFRMTIHEPLTVDAVGRSRSRRAGADDEAQRGARGGDPQASVAMAMDPSALAEGRRQALYAPRARSSGFRRRRRARGARRIEFDLKPVHRPMQMRARGAARHADKTDHLTARHALVRLHQQFALVDIARSKRRGRDRAW